MVRRYAFRAGDCPTSSVDPVDTMITMLTRRMSLFDVLLGRGTAERVRSGRPPIWPLAVIVAAGVLVYLNSFHGVFVFDDHGNIVDNQKIRSFEHLWDNRPLVQLSLAVNYYFGELNVWGYHLVNLGIHLLFHTGVPVALKRVP